MATPASTAEIKKNTMVRNALSLSSWKSEVKAMYPGVKFMRIPHSDAWVARIKKGRVNYSVGHFGFLNMVRTSIMKRPFNEDTLVFDY
jgi:hypothetical protein